MTIKLRCSFFQATVVLILLYGCTTWTLTKRMEEKLDSNYTRMMWAILNKSWIATLYGQLPPITRTIQVRRTRHAGHCWRSNHELISDIHFPSSGRAKARRQARTCIPQLCAATGYSLEDLPWAMDDRDGWWERVREIRTGRVTWWWWWWCCWIWIVIVFWG